MRRRLVVVLGLLALAIAVVVSLLLRASSSSQPERTTGDPAVTGAASGAGADRAEAASLGAAPADDSEAARIAAAVAEAPRYPVDLDWLRARLPDNLYWRDGAPTSDPEVAKQRAERARKANELYGRVQTGEASEQEIRDYYEEKRRLSQDYQALAELVLKEKGAELPERDRGMFELSARMHRDRLAQIDRDLADAQARRAAKAGAGGRTSAGP